MSDYDLDAVRKPYSPHWELASDDALNYFFSDNKDAVNLMKYLCKFANVYDDLIDKDKDIADDEIHLMFSNLLLDIPNNQFFKENLDAVVAVITTGLLNYHAANQIEKIGNLEELRISHSLRYSMIDVGLLCMKICSGYKFATKNARRARLMFQNDTWEHYKLEHYKVE